MHYDPKKAVIINDAGYAVAHDVRPDAGYQMARSQVFFDQVVAALDDLLSTEDCVCVEAELPKGDCSVCQYAKLLKRIRVWPMKEVRR